MNPNAKISKAEIGNLINELMKEYRVAGPVMEGGKLSFGQIDKAEDMVITDELPYKSPKEFLFPQFEKIISFDSDAGVLEKEKVENTIVFGVKPCDLEAIKVMSAVFTQGQFVDTFYKERLDNTVFIGMACEKEKSGCFCGQRGIDKGYSSDCDIFIREIKDDYILEAISDKGKAIVDGLKLDVVEGEDYQSSKEKLDTSSKDGDRLLEIEAEEMDIFEKVDWDRISEICLGCGVCTYICPTCHCFDFKDVKEKGVSTRYRCWDSCMYPKFTLHASGHNPRPSSKERIRQRVMHKYMYIKKNFGYTACTGCGRCIKNCPAGMNIKSVVSDIMEELK